MPRCITVGLYPAALSAAFLTSCLYSADSRPGHAREQSTSEVSEIPDADSDTDAVSRLDDAIAMSTEQETQRVEEQATESAAVGATSVEATLLADSSPKNESSSVCPSDMVEIEGEFCPAVVQECLRWIDKDRINKAGNIDPNMCAEFRYPSKCVSTKRVSMHFCVDRYEWPNKAAEVPATRMSWVEAKSNCESVGKRLCRDDEWTFACEGPSMKPYPYGDGYHRDSSICNMDRKPWIDPWANPFEVVDKREPSGAHEACQSDWGVYDIVGNVDEWVYNTQGGAHHEPWISGLMGGHWVHGIRNRCRAITDSHEPTFTFYVTGARCCADVVQESGDPASAGAPTNE